MIRTFAIVVVSILAAALSSCASTSVESFKDPEFSDAAYRKLAVYAKTENLQWRISMEDAMASSIRYRGGRAVPSYRLLPPTRTFSSDEVFAVLAEAGVDGVVMTEIGDTGVDEDWVPQYGSVHTVSGNQVTTQNYGGYTVEKPWANMQTKLFDVATGSNVWIASSSTGGNGFASFETVRSSYSTKIAQELHRDGLLARYDKSQAQSRSSCTDKPRHWGSPKPNCD